MTRRDHGLLVAALTPPLGRTLMVTKLDEIAEYAGREFLLSTNRWSDGTVDPHGDRHLEHFRLAGTTPVWTYACAGALVEKRVWMRPGENTTYVHYQPTRNFPQAFTHIALINTVVRLAAARAGSTPLAHAIVEQAGKHDSAQTKTRAVSHRRAYYDATTPARASRRERRTPDASDDPAAKRTEMMRQHQVRRVPVVDDQQRRFRGSCRPRAQQATGKSRGRAA